MTRPAEWSQRGDVGDCDGQVYPTPGRESRPEELVQQGTSVREHQCVVERVRPACGSCRGGGEVPEDSSEQSDPIDSSSRVRQGDSHEGHAHRPVEKGRRERHAGSDLDRASTDDDDDAEG